MLITKCNGGFLEVRLVEVLWKNVSGILNRRLMMVIVYHDTLYGFYSGRETGNTSLEVRMFQNMVSLREEVLYEIFINIH